MIPRPQGFFRHLGGFFRPYQLRSVPPLLFVVLGSLLGISFLLLYSAGGGFSPWCLRQACHLGLGVSALFLLASCPLSFFTSLAYVFYALALACLLATTFLGAVGMGAQRWIDLGFVKFQPSEIMRIALVLALARRLNEVPLATGWRAYVGPLLLIFAPVLLTLEQPDLGTAVLLVLSGGSLFFFAQASPRFFGGGVALLASLGPLFWTFLHNYQKHRILTFLNPESDPLGRGYHALQSKIAIGSGGVWGKGFMNGTQGSLDFLPEKHTDFIFTLLSEEWGFIGALTLLGLYLLLILVNLLNALRARNDEERLIIAGLTVSFASYLVINIGMVVGLLPVVGIPLPLISYGGSSLLTLLASQGIMISAASSQYRPWQRT